MQAQRHLVLAGLFDRLGELDLAPVDLDALRGEQLRDLRRGDGAEQLALFAHLHRDLERDRLDARLLGVERLALPRHLVGDHALVVLERLHARLGGGDRLALREQAVAREARAHLPRLAGVAEPRDVFAQDDLHSRHARSFVRLYFARREHAARQVTARGATRTASARAGARA